LPDSAFQKLVVDDLVNNNIWLDEKRICWLEAVINILVNNSVVADSFHQLPF